MSAQPGLLIGHTHVGKQSGMTWNSSKLEALSKFIYQRVNYKKD